MSAYSGYYLDKEKLLQSSSGGGASAISEAIINEGGVVFGACYSKDFKSAEFACVEKLEELHKLKTSKYIETSKRIFQNGEYKSIYLAVAEKLQSGSTVLFTGLGCDVAALYSFLRAKNVDTSSLFTVDLICYGPTSSEVAKQYTDSLEKRFASKIIDFSVRYKKHGWTPAYIFAKFENGKIFTKNFYASDYGYAFSVHARLSCYSCKFRGKNHQADLTLGDYWGLTPDMKEYNQNGVSIFIVRTERGEELIAKINKNEFKLQRTDVDFALSHNTMYYKTRKKSQTWEMFDKHLTTKGLHYAVVKDQSFPKRFIKTIRPIIISILPNSVKNIIKKLLKKKA